MLMAPRARDRAAHRLAESSCDGIKRLLCGTSSCPGCCGEHRRSTWGGAKIYLSEAETGDLRTSRDEMQDDEPPKQKPRRTERKGNGNATGTAEVQICLSYYCCNDYHSFPILSNSSRE